MIRTLGARAARASIAAATAGVLLAAPALAGPSAGAPGVGDRLYPTEGNGGYDVSNYSIRLGFDPDADTVSGSTTIVATATKDLSAFNLDFAHTPRSVLVNNRPAKISREGKELTVTPATPLRSGQQMLVVVSYSVQPGTADQGALEGTWINNSDGAIAVGEPEHAAAWYPVNGHPQDKATYDITMITPRGMDVLSSGVSKGSRMLPADKEAHYYVSTKPTASYLIMLAMGDYQTHTGRAQTERGEVPVLNGYSEGLDPATRGAATASVGRTPEIVNFLEQRFGPYPFEAEGGVVTSSPLGFALETQGRPIYTPGFFSLGANTSVIVHENAHQWFGDSVSVRNWEDIWVNEGFASYSEWMWSEAQGEGTAQQLLEYYYNSYPADSSFWQVLPGKPAVKGEVFHPAVYDRGAMTLQVLRNRIGDDAFFATMKAWTSGRQYGNGSVQDFIALSEAVSGQDLDQLFDTWLFTKGKPDLETAAAAGLSAQRVAQVPKPDSVDQMDATHRLLAQRH